MKGLIFDFNGTLFRDSNKHEEAWNIFCSKHSNKQLTKEEFDHNIHGKSNHQVIEFIFGKQFSIDQANYFAEEKESLYRDLCLEDKSSLHLIGGAEAFLDYLVKKEYAFTIATSSGKENLDFYFEVFHLSRWFDYGKIIYSDGYLISKPSPDAYLKASKVLGILPNDCVVFEDSYSGIKSAKNANVGTIVAISTDGNDTELQKMNATIVVDNYLDARIKNCI